MNSQPEHHRYYTNHRENQRERILEVAEKLFLRDGIDSTTLAQIAIAARLTRVTLYQYFPDKKEIAWAVFQKVIDELQAVMVGELDQTIGNGYDKVERVLLATIKSLETQTDSLRFIALFNFLYAREGSPMRMRGILEQAAMTGKHGSTADLIREGIADGSLRPDLDADLTAASISNLLAGMTSRFALLGTNVEQEFGYKNSELFHEILDNFLRGIRAS
jgi:AcrR family transcriptional regulator